MAASDASLSLSSKPTPKQEHDHEPEKDNLSLLLHKYKDKLTTLPKQKGWMGENLYMYQGFWYGSTSAFSVQTTMAMQDSFKPLPTDIYLLTLPKSGTTWVKALMFATVNRTTYNHNSNTSVLTHPLFVSNPHNCVPFIEPEFVNKTPTYVQENPNPNPRLFSTHIPYTSLPRSILDSGCRLVYLCRNPKDVMVSWYYFSNKFTLKNLSPMTIDEMFEVFVKGTVPYGPYWDHVKEYYNASCEHPTKILFLTYEVMKKDTVNQVKRIAEFLGCPFSKEEETEGCVEEIMRLCSLEVLKEVNKDGEYSEGVPNAVFFREGKVGGWREDLTDEMSKTLDDITNEKFQDLGILF
ncbi:hypothetical protein LXL04_006268 [Taraxacum kok-saghyz]